ncbi:MAG: primosomal protein N' [Candidatus Amoebophilus sp. 36-38]|nr:MAG: primosomal protein N' [Candidatus Amoebophilus sp. 36-38]
MSNNHTKDDLAYFAEIILPLPIAKLLTYGIPPHLLNSIREGSRVIVSLGNKKLLTGIVNRLHQTAPPYATKNIMDVLDESPILNKQQLAFFQWMAQYYMCTIGDVLKAALPAGFKLSSQSKICLHPNFDEAHATFSEQETRLIEALKNGKTLSYQQVERLAGQKEAYKLLKNLMQQQAIMFLEEIQEKYFPKKAKQVSLNKSYVEDSNELELLFQQLEKKPKQLDVLLQYMSFVTEISEPKGNYFISKKKLLQQGISSSSLQNLIQHGIFVEKEITVSRIEQIKSLETSNTILSPAQTQALLEIKENFKNKNNVLLHGITGSGKTEIYTELIQEVIERQGQVLYLLPEIGLATQIVQRLQKKFGDKMGVYHSKYASNERVEIWNDVLSGKLRLVVGVRSALFLPFDQLQLIIVDEEHETAYKQFDGTPRYHARDAAVMLATYHQSKVLLGSATPAMETYYNVQRKKYGLVKLTERFSQTSLPKITLVNLRTEQRHKKLQGEFSRILIQALEEVFQHQEQAIIFQNRRGYASYILCQTCAWVPTCQQCSVSLTYHQFKDYLVCHYCGYHFKLPPVCQECGAHTLKNMGFGTEKIEETLQQFFPDKHIQRMDLDTTRRKHSYEKIIANLEKGYTDVLVGTQMITKGLDFGQVSLVGVLDLDRSLYFPDFRSNERCFQLITQVSGRAGRRDKQGQVIIQTANPTHPILQDIVAYDYEQMYEKELLERQKFRYPPYVRLIKITCQHPSESLVKESGRYLTQQLHQFLDVDSILGPQAPLIAKLKNQFRMDIWIKLAKSTDQLLLAIKEQIQEATKRLLTQKPYRQVRVIFDVDPI